MSKYIPQLKPGDLFFRDIGYDKKVFGMILEVYKGSYKIIWLDKGYRGKIIRDDANYIDGLELSKW